MMQYTLHEIKWARMEHCPTKQLFKPGVATDAGLDIASAEDKIILPYNQTKKEMVRIERPDGSFVKLNDYLPAEDQEVNDDNMRMYTNLENYLETDIEGYILRPKYKGVLVKTGIRVHPEDLMFTQIYSRSSAVKMGMSLANSVGIVDYSYSGELMVALYSLNPDAPSFICKGERIAQLVPQEQVRINMVEVSEETYEENAKKRGERSGFGSTGFSTYSTPNPQFI